MTDLARWLSERRPTPPADVRHALSDDIAEGGGELRSMAEDRLSRALAQTGRVRESAFHLLAADAWLTYACEAAVEGDEPEDALARLLAIGAPR